MLTAYPLSCDQIESFRCQGVTLCRKLVNVETVQLLQRWYDEFLLWCRQGSRDRGLVYIDEPGRRLEGWTSSQFYRSARQVAGRLLGQEVGYREDQVIMKPAGYEGESPWHQDAAYWRRLGVEVQDAVVCWLALSSTSSGSGGLQFVPGRHHGTLLEHRDVADLHDLPEALECDVGDTARFAPELQPGDATFHHYRTPHYSAGNRTSGTRRAWTIHFWPLHLLEGRR